MDVQQPAYIPTLASMYTDTWSDLGTDDDLSDDDFPDPGSDLDLSPPTTESEETSESEKSSDSDSDMEAGYVLGRICALRSHLLFHSIGRNTY
jgi:hypothetical protein